ncbi:MAG: hypothetical protein ACKO2G_07455 [Verrucomicrobiales bacterium]
MNPHQQPDPELLTRWSDGELDEATRAALAADPALHAMLEQEKSSARALGDLLRSQYPAARDVAGPELFMHQLNHRLDQASEAPVLETPAAAGGSRFPLWLAAAAAIVALALAVRPLFQDGGQANPTFAAAPTTPDALLATYAPDASLDITARYDETADAVVIVVDGLKPVANPDDLAAFLPDDPRPIQTRLAGHVPAHRFEGGHDGGS